MDFLLDPGTDEWICKLSEFSMFERMGCPFLTFELVFASNSGPVHIHIRGSKAAKEFIKKRDYNSNPKDWEYCYYLNLLGQRAFG